MTIMAAALLICVVIAVSMPKVHDYHTDLGNINYRLSMIENNLARIADNLARIAERMDKADGQNKSR